MISDTIRENYKTLILKHIKSKQQPRKHEKIQAEQIENSIFNYVNNYNINDIESFQELYFQVAHYIYQNINPKILGNQNFIQKIKNNQIDLNNIANLRPWEIFPEQWTKLTEEQTKEDKISFVKTPIANTTQFTCSKCKKNLCSFTEVQTRSADESATLFITCLNEECGHKWRIG